MNKPIQIDQLKYNQSSGPVFNTTRISSGVCLTSPANQ